MRIMREVRDGYHIKLAKIFVEIFMDISWRKLWRMFNKLAKLVIF